MAWWRAGPSPRPWRATTRSGSATGSNRCAARSRGAWTQARGARCRRPPSPSSTSWIPDSGTSSAGPTWGMPTCRSASTRSRSVSAAPTTRTRSRRRSRTSATASASAARPSIPTATGSPARPGRARLMSRRRARASTCACPATRAAPRPTSQAAGRWRATTSPTPPPPSGATSPPPCCPTPRRCGGARSRCPRTATRRVPTSTSPTA